MYTARRFASNAGILLCVLIIALLTGCGGGDSTASTGPTPATNAVITSPAGIYSITYTGAETTAGKSSFQISIVRRSDNAAATGLADHITLDPMMTGGMSHSAPVDIITESSTPGTYNCTIYYLMPNEMGSSWQLDVMIDSEMATFYPSVVNPANSDPIFKRLYGSDDIVTIMSTTTSNRYYILRDGPVSSGTTTLGLFIAHSEQMGQYFAPVSVGSLVSVSTGTEAVSAMTLKASTDNSTYVDAVDDHNGHWSVPNLTLASGVTTTVYVKLNVSTTITEDKTTNGAPASGSNAYAAMAVTPE